jgi:hypothetical protein
MAWFNIFSNDNDDQLNEELKQFHRKGEKILTPAQQKKKGGEGIEDIQLVQGFGNVGMSSFDTFYQRYINKAYENELVRMNEYRNMAQMSEIADVIEDATNESTQEDENGDTLKLIIKDADLKQNENILNNIEEEFRKLFYHNIDINEKLWDIFRTYFIDGRVFYERIIDTAHPKNGIINIKKLPTESMDYYIDPISGQIVKYFQYLSERPKRPNSIQEAYEADDIIVFDANQISFPNYGVYGNNKYEILGYLDKARVPYNQLKLLETSVIIYRIVRAPERLVFRIDTGAMPMDKAMKFVEKVKSKMVKKQSYDATTGRLSQEPEVLSILENYYLPQSSDGRGSQIETVGGNSSGFTELDDIYYFARKLYRALKYPMSRVSANQEKRESDVLFGGNQVSEISRDEIKWARFLERQQNRICDEFLDLFLMHMNFKGLKEQYGLTKKNIEVRLNSPSHYKEQADQAFLMTEFDNYNAVADREEISKSFAMKKYLHWDMDTIKENVAGFKADKELGLVKDESSGF